MTKEDISSSDSARTRIEEEIRRLSKREMSESMSARAVADFENNQFQIERLKTILALSELTDLPVETVSKRNQVEHNVMSVLTSRGEIELAREVAVNPIQAREKCRELFENAERFVGGSR